MPFRCSGWIRDCFDARGNATARYRLLGIRCSTPAEGRERPPAGARLSAGVGDLLCGSTFV